MSQALSPKRTLIFTSDKPTRINGGPPENQLFIPNQPVSMKSSTNCLYMIAITLFSLLGLTSCGDIEQNLKINADGSGVLETSLDIGEMMSMAKGMGEMNDLNSEDVTISADEPKDTSTIAEEPKDPMQMLIDKVTDPAYNRDFDTLISFISIMPDSVKQKQQRMDLVEKLSIHLKSPASSSSLIMGIVMTYDNRAQLNELIQYLKTMDDSPTSGMMSTMGGGGLQSETFLSYDADLAKGWIRVDSVDYSGMAGEMGMSSDSLMSSEDMGMLEMMFGNSKLRTIIHVPGEVTSCTNKDAILTKDDKVIVEYDFIDILKKGKAPGYTINFKPKK